MGNKITFDEAVADIRKQIKEVAKNVKSLKDGRANSETDGVEDFGEVMANLTLMTS